MSDILNYYKQLCSDDRTEYASQDTLHGALRGACRLIAALEYRLAIADFMVDIADEFINDFLNKKTVMPGALIRVIKTYLEAKGK